MITRRRESAPHHRSISVLPLLFLGCPPSPPTPTPVPTEPPPVDCARWLEPPLGWVAVDGFTGAEDFAFTPDGAVISVDGQGRLVRQTRAGDTTVIRGGLGETAGLVLTPDGTVIVADVLAGALLAVGMDGSTRTLTTGLAYPNGLALDGADHVLVTEQSDGRLSRIDLNTGAQETLATGLDRPNGVTIDASGTIYVASFGSGTITRITDAGPELFGDVEILQPQTPCPFDGIPCMLGARPGRCTQERCEPLEDRDACSDRDEGAPCTTSLFGVTVESRCRSGLCPFTPRDQLDACHGRTEGAACLADGFAGTCAFSVQGVLACSTGQGVDSCTTVGETCTWMDGLYPFLGQCLDFGGAPVCRPDDLDPIGGGLDGLYADPCGSVWATEYRTGRLHRWTREGGRSDVALTLPSAWIPNLRPGPGIGGFRADALYVMDRESGALFEVRSVLE